MEFTICRDRKSQTWVVYREGGEHEQHAHLRSRKSCLLLIKLIKQGTMPRSEYMQGSVRRLLTDQEVAALHKPKDRYYNCQRR